MLSLSDLNAVLTAQGRTVTTAPWSVLDPPDPVKQDLKAEESARGSLQLPHSMLSWNTRRQCPLPASDALGAGGSRPQPGLWYFCEG